MATVNIHLRVLDSKKKSKFTHFSIEAVPIFDDPEILKEYLVKNHASIMSPAATSSDFTMGYIVEGRGNHKYSIIDSTTLKQAYETAANNRLCLWVDIDVKVAGAKRACDGKD